MPLPLALAAAILAVAILTAFAAWSFALTVRPTRFVTQGRWQEAVRAATRLERSWLRILPGVRSGAVYTRALCLHLEGNFDQALTLLRTIENWRGLSHEAALLEAGSLVMAGRDFERATRMLTPLCTPASPPEDTMLLAVACHASGERERAEQLFASAGTTRAKSAPSPMINGPVFHYLRGLYLLDTRGVRDAATDLETAASSPVVTIYVERARALVAPTSCTELDPRSTLAPQVIEE